MRKEIIYSLAALTGIPVMANAANYVGVQSNVLGQSLATTLNGEVILAEDVVLEKADSMELKFPNVNFSENFTVTIYEGNDVIATKTFPTGAPEVKLNFKLDHKATVKVVMNSAANYSIGTSGQPSTFPFFNLVYDFKAAAATLQQRLAPIVAMQAGTNNSKRYISDDNNHYVSFYSTENAYIEAIDTVPNNSATAYEEIYKALNLSGIDNKTDTVTTLIKRHANAAKKLEEAALADSLQKQKDCLDTLFTTAQQSGDAYKALKQKLDNIQTKIGQYHNIDAMDEPLSDISSAAIQDSLEQAQNLLAEAIQKYEFYKGASKSIDTLIAVKEWVKDSLYSKISNASLKGKLDDELNKVGDKTTDKSRIKKLNDAIETAYKAGDLEEKWNATPKGLKADRDTIFNGTYTAPVANPATPAVVVFGNTPDCILEGILEKYDSLAAYQAFVDSVGTKDNGKTDSLFAVVMKGNTPISNENRSLKYMHEKYYPIFKKIYGDTKTKDNTAFKYDSLANELADGIRDSIAKLQGEILSVATKATVDPQKAYTSHLSDSVKAVEKAYAKYEKYAPLVDMIDSINLLKDTLQQQLVGYQKNATAKTSIDGVTDSIYKVIINGQVRKEYKLSDYYWSSNIKGALTADSLRKAIVKLENHVDTLTTDEAAAFQAIFKNGGSGFEGYTQLMSDIKALGTAARTTAENWLAVQTRLIELSDTLTEVENKVKTLDIYNYSVVKDGIVYGNYKGKIDSIKGKKDGNYDSFNFILNESAGTTVDDILNTGKDPKQYKAHTIQAVSDSLINSTGAGLAGKTHAELQTAFVGANGGFKKGVAGAQINIDDTLAIQKAIEALAANYKKDSLVYDSLSKEAMKDTLKAKVLNMINGLRNDSIAVLEAGGSEAEAKKLYGAAFDGLKEQVKAIIQELRDSVPEGTNQYGAMKWASMPNNDAVNWDSIKVFSDKLRPLVERMEIVKAAAETAKKNKIKNDSIMNVLGKDTLAIKNLLEEIRKKVVVTTPAGEYNDWYYTNAKLAKYPGDSLINVYKGDSAWFDQEYARLSAIYHKDSADLKNDSLHGELIVNSDAWKDKLTGLKNQVNTFVAQVDKKYDNWKALFDLKDGLYNDIAEAIVKADTLIKKVGESEFADAAGIEAIPFYLEKLAGFEEKFVGKHDTDSVYDTGVRDRVFASYYNDALGEEKIPFMIELVTLADSLNKLPGRVKTNKENFDIIYNDSAIIDRRIYKLRNDSLSDSNYQLADRDSLLDELQKIENDFVKVKPKELYVNGACEDITAPLATYSDVKRRLNQLYRAMTENYDGRIAAAHEKFLSELEKKYNETRDLYEDVVKDQNDFMLVTNPALRKAVEKAAEKMGGFNDSLATYPAKINKAYNTIQNAIETFEQENSNKVYPHFKEDTTQTFVKYQSEMKKLEREFIQETWNQISDTLTKLDNLIKVDTVKAEAARLSFYHFNGELTGSENVTDSLEKLNSKVITYTKQLNAAIKDSDIVELDAALNNFRAIGYPQSMTTVLEKAAGDDIADGLETAMGIIAAGDLYFSTVADDDPVKVQFESNKQNVLGTFDKDGKLTAYGVVQHIARILDPENDSVFVKNYGKGNSDTLKVNAKYKWSGLTGYVEGAKLADVLNAFNTGNAFTAAGKNLEAYATLMGNMADLENKLDSVIAEAKADGYAVVEKMQNPGGAYSVIQQAIDAQEKTYENLLTADTAYKIKDADIAFYENTLRKIEDVVNKLQNDTTTKYTDKLTAKTLYGEEVDFIDAKKTDLLALFNVIAANANAAGTQAAAKEWEDSINAIYTDFSALVAKENDKKEKTATPAEMLAIQKRIEALMDTLTAVAGEDGDLAVAFAKQGLTNKAEAIQEQAESALGNAKDLTDEEAADFAAQLALIDADLDDIKEDVAADDNILFNKENYGEQIKSDSLAIDAIKKDAEKKSAENKKFNDFYAKLNLSLDSLRDSIQATKDNFGDFEKVTVSDFSGKFGLVDQRVALLEAAIEANAALDPKDRKNENDTTKLKQTIANGIAATKGDLNAILDEASLRDINQRANALKKEADAIKLNKDLFLASDYAELKAALDTINKMILVKSKDGLRDSLGLIAKAKTATEAGFYGLVADPATNKYGFSALKDSADNIEKRIAELKLNIELLSAAAEDDVRGDLTGDGEITREDLQMLIDIIKNQEEDDLDEDMFKRCDTNLDGVIDVTDIIWLQEMYMYGEWPAVADEAAASRSLFNSADKLNAQNMGTQNGITRMAINLDNNKAYQAFQMDFQLPEGAKVVEAKLGDRVIKSELMTSENGTNFRVIAMSNSLSPIQGNKGAVLYLDIEGMNGELTGEATFVKKNFGSEHFSISVTTAIDKVKNAAAAAGQTIYNLGGRMVDGLKKGVNILRGEDGSAKKVIKK